MHFSILSKSRTSSRKSKSQTKSNKYLSKAQIALIITTLTAIIVLYGMKDQTNVVYTTSVYMLEQLKQKQTLLWNSELGQKVIQFVKTYNPWSEKGIVPYTHNWTRRTIPLPPVPTEAFKRMGLPINATLSELKKHYRKVALLLHPDKPGGNVKTFRNLNNNYEILVKYLKLS